MIDVHNTDGKVALAYLKVLERHWGKVKRAKIENGWITCETHGELVVGAKTPKGLERQLIMLEND